MKATKKMFMGLGLLGVFAFLTSPASAACQDITLGGNQKFCFDIQKVSSERFQAKISNTQNLSDSDLSCRVTLPDNSNVNLPGCEGTFTYTRGGVGRLTLRVDTSTYWYELITNYDFSAGSFTIGSNTTPSYYQPEISYVSTERPQRDQWIDVGVRLDTSTNYASSQIVNFRVEEYRNGSWQTASSYKYDLSQSSYTFSSYERGEKRFTNFLRFRNDGEYRLYVKSQDGYSVYRTFIVNGYTTSSSYTPERIQVNPSVPRQDQWIDMTLRVRKNSSSYYDYYNGNVTFRVEEYRNGNWQYAYNSSYVLDKNSYYLSHRDNGEVRLYDFIKFTAPGEYRVIAQLDSYEGIQTSYSFLIKNRDNSNNTYYGNSSYFTSKELGKVRAVANIWNDVIAALARDYPKLAIDSQRKRISNDFYINMQDVFRYPNSARFKNWDAFYKAFQEWFSYTIRNR